MKHSYKGFFNRLLTKVSMTYEGDIIPPRTRWGYPISGLGRDAMYAIVSAFLLVFVQESGYLGSGADYNLQFAIITGLIIGYRIFDAVNDPLMGVIIEKVHFKTGKFKPWIVIGAWTNSITVLALFGAPALFTWCRGWGFVGWFAVFYLLFGITFTMNDISFCSMLPSLSQNEQQRAKICSTLMIFENIGAFTVNFFIPMFATPEKLGPNIYWITAVIATSLYIVGQTLIFFICPEKKRDIKAEANAPKTKFSDLFKIIKDNKLVRLMAIVVFLWFVSTGLFNVLMQNVFYLQAGYEVGKTMMTIFAVVQVLAVIIPNILMPKLLEKFPKMTLFKFFMFTILIGYFLYFIYGSPFGNFYFAPTSSKIGYAILLFSILLVTSLCTGAIYTIIFLFMSNTIEYNEWKFGERKESIIFALRPFSTKLASSIEQGFSSLALFTTGAINVSNKINELTDKKASSEEIQRAIDQIITPSMTWGLKSWAVLLPMGVLIINLIITAKFYDLSEDKYRQICLEIKQRNKTNA